MEGGRWRRVGVGRGGRAAKAGKRRRRREGRVSRGEVEGRDADVKAGRRRARRQSGGGEQVVAVAGGSRRQWIGHRWGRSEARLELNERQRGRKAA